MRGHRCLRGHGLFNQVPTHARAMRLLAQYLTKRAPAGLTMPKPQHESSHVFERHTLRQLGFDVRLEPAQQRRARQWCAACSFAIEAM